MAQYLHICIYYFIKKKKKNSSQLWPKFYLFSWVAQKIPQKERKNKTLRMLNRKKKKNIYKKTDSREISPKPDQNLKMSIYTQILFSFSHILLSS